jgi:hypothetical protein
VSIIAALIDWTASVELEGVVRSMLGVFGDATPDGKDVVTAGWGAIGVGRLISAKSGTRQTGLHSSDGSLAVLDGRLRELPALRSALGAMALAVSHTLRGTLPL